MQHTLAPKTNMHRLEPYKVFQAAEAVLADLQEGRARLAENVAKRLMGKTTALHPKGFKRKEADGMVHRHLASAIAFYGNQQETVAMWLRSRARYSILENRKTMLVLDQDYRTIRDYLGRKVKPWAKRVA